MHLERQRPAARTIARAMGWFGIALGTAELLMPGPVSRGIGLHGRQRLLRACGVREIVTGIGLLADRRPGLWMWARVAGDALDAGALARGRGMPARVSLGIVAAVAAADLACAAALSRRSRQVQPAHADGGRRGLPRAPSRMRGPAREDLEGPRDLQARPRLRPYSPDGRSREPQPAATGPRWTSG